MDTVLELQQERAHKLRCAQDIMATAEKEGRAMTAQECALFDEAMASVETMDAQIKERQETANRRDALQKKRDELAQSHRVVPPAQPARVEVVGQFGGNQEFRRGRRLRAFTGPDAARKAYAAGRWAMAVIFRDDRSARWCENHFPGFRNALGENVNENGGVLVPEELAQTIIDLREQYGIFRQEAFIWPMKSDTALVPRRSGGVTMYFAAENPTSGVTKSTPTWNQVQLVAKKAFGEVNCSSEIDEDSFIDLGEWIAQEVAYAAALLEDQCGFIGDGTSTYGGMRGLGNIFTTTGGSGGVQLNGAVDAASAHDTFAEIDATDLATVMSRLPQYARPNAKWFVSSVAMDLVFGRLMMAAGGNTINDQMQGYQPRYAGYPIVISQVLPTSTGDLSDLPMFYFGDLRKASTLGSRRQIRVFRSEHRYAELDQIGFFFSTRFDIVNHDVGGTAAGTAGPIVALGGE